MLCHLLTEGEPGGRVDCLLPVLAQAQLALSVAPPAPDSTLRADQ